MARRIRVYEALFGDTGSGAAQFHVFGVLDTSVAMTFGGRFIVWPQNREDSILRDTHDWRLIYEGDAS